MLARSAFSHSLLPLPVEDPSQPATDYEFADGSGRIGFINPVTQPFCGNCNRLRLTAEGKVRNCLFSTVEWDARAILRGAAPDGGHTDEDLAELVRACVAAKKLGLFAIVAAFVLKFAKVIFVGLAVAGAGVMNFFRRKPRNDPADGQA